jgi:hypothetical protein
MFDMLINTYSSKSLRCMQYNEFIDALQSGIAAAVPTLPGGNEAATKRISPEGAQGAAMLASLMDNSSQSVKAHNTSRASSIGRTLQKMMSRSSVANTIAPVPAVMMMGPTV